MNEELEELKEDIRSTVDEFIESHPEIDPSEVWTAVEQLAVNA